MVTEPRVVIIISNFNGATTFYNGKPIIDLCVESLRKTKYGNYRVLVADGCSSDGSVEHIRKKFPEVSLIRDKTNVGLARSFDGAMKFALREYAPEYLLLFNNDIIVRKGDWLGKLVEVAESDRKIGMVGCKLLYPDGRIQHAGAILDMTAHSRGRAEADSGKYDLIEDLDVITGAVLLIKKEVVLKIGVWDTNYAMGYEDIDYCVRARNAGFRVVYDGKTSLTHLEGSTSTNSKSKAVRSNMFFTSQRNYIYFTRKHFGFFKRVGAILVCLANCLVSVEGKDRTRGMESVRLKNDIAWRLRVTAKAVIDGYGMPISSDKPEKYAHFTVVRR